MKKQKEVRRIIAGDFHFIETAPDSYRFAIPGGQLWYQQKLLNWLRAQGLTFNFEYMPYTMEE